MKTSLVDQVQLKKYFPYIDILKIVSCLGIVCIHTKPFETTCFQETFVRICPAFVSIFFLLSSLLFWKKVSWDNNDKKILWKYISRLLIIYILWSLIFSPIWIYPLWKTYQTDIWWIVPLKFVFYGGCSGSWFIVSLIYGTLIVYIVNRFINKHIAFILFLFVFIYYGYVFWGGEDVFHLFWQGTAWFPSPYYSMARSVFWIECSLYLPNIIKIVKVNNLKVLLLILIVFWSVLAFYNCCGNFQYIVNAIVAIVLSLSCLKSSDLFLMNSILPILRNYTIVIYFVHFFYQRVFLHFISFGLDLFISTLFCTCFTAFIIIKVSAKFKILKYLY